MKVSSVILALLNAMLASTVTAAPLVGHSRALEDDMAKVSLEELNRGIPDLLSRVSQPADGRRLSSPLDKLDVLIKNVDCFACMEAPPVPVVRHLRAEDGTRALTPNNNVFVNAHSCDANDPYQIWNLLSLEPTGTWFLFESAETGQCMQLVGTCEPNGLLYDIEMGPCDASNGKAYWGFTGIGEIVHFECLRSNYESDVLTHSTPDIYLEADCTATQRLDYLDLSSDSADSRDQAENYWILFPKSFGSIVPP